ncbi:MAG: universal stress protein [Desulfohalobiaceae bacterium]|nr:universal stress protein [Desulfohalobiaceae bacterium]
MDHATKKILVPIGIKAVDLKSLQYALALARRLQTQIYILQHSGFSEDAVTPFNPWLDETLRSLINDARQAGVIVTHYVVTSHFEEEIVDLARAEHIDLLIFNTGEEVSERLLFRIKPLVPGQIIQVRQKDDRHIIHGEEN